MAGREEREEKRIIEVANYVDALEECLHDVRKGRRIDRRMFKGAHKKLMQGIR